MRFSAAARSLRRRLAIVVDTLLAWPGTAYARAYAALRLNERYHRLGLSAAAQIRLVPRRLTVACGLMEQPYRFPLQAVRWGGRPAGGERRVGHGHGRGLIFDGDWDVADKRPIEDYLGSYVYSQTVLQFLGQGVDHRETPQYHEMMSCLRRGAIGHWRLRRCRTAADVDAYFTTMKGTFEAIGRNGYRSQVELGAPDRFDEIKVFVDRNGELHKLQGAGHHRLAMARLLALNDVPLVVLGVHRRWALRCFAAAGGGADIITAIDRGLRAAAVQAPSARSSSGLSPRP